jgi:hypothetical protein
VGYCSVMGDRLERTEVWQQHHDRVTAEIPVVVSDNEDHDLFRKALDAEAERSRRFLDADARLKWFDPMHEDDPVPAALAGLRSSVLPEGDEPVMM